MPEIIQPTLLLDKQKCIRNIESIISKAEKSGVKYRPHFKTHQSRIIGNWFRDRGVTSCTVSSLDMADYFARDNWNDITVAFPLNYLEAQKINDLSSTIKLNILVSLPGVLPKLIQKLENRVGVYIEVDSGYHRTGISPDDVTSIDLVLDEIQTSDRLVFEGFLSHAGHTYKCTSRSEVEAIHKEEIKALGHLKDRYKSRFPQLKLSIGDTPACSIVDQFSDVDEIRAGNLVFYDLTQFKIGSCDIDQIAIALACPVVATYPARNEVIIYGGGVHFSKDFLRLESGDISYGTIVALNGKGWSLPATSMYVKSLSQEHGIVHAPDSQAEKIRVGDILGILPAHACLMADAMPGYVTLDGTEIGKMN